MYAHSLNPPAKVHPSRLNVSVSGVDNVEGTRHTAVMVECGTDKTRMLIPIWGAADMQEKLDSVVRNQVVYEAIARAIVKLDISILDRKVKLWLRVV